jgi:hypothetical protein
VPRSLDYDAELDPDFRLDAWNLMWVRVPDGNAGLRQWPCGIAILAVGSGDEHDHRRHIFSGRCLPARLLIRRSLGLWAFAC